MFPAPSTATRFALQFLHRLGSFLNCLSWKNNCSPDVNTKSAPQSMHFNILSRNSIEDAPSAHSRPHSPPDEKITLSPGARMRRIFDSSPSVELPLDSARHALTGHGLLLVQKLRRPRGYAYPRLGNALHKREEGRHPGRSGPVSISPALSELFSGCVCAPMLPSRASSRPASNKRSGV